MGYVFNSIYRSDIMQCVYIRVYYIWAAAAHFEGHTFADLISQDVLKDDKEWICIT